MQYGDMCQMLKAVQRGCHYTDIALELRAEGNGYIYANTEQTPVGYFTSPEDFREECERLIRKGQLQYDE